MVQSVITRGFLATMLVISSACDVTGPPLPDTVDLELQAISAGWGHSCAIDPGGAAFCWGSNRWGELGAGPGTPLVSFFTPQRVVHAESFVAVEAGQLHTCALLLAAVQNYTQVAIENVTPAF